MSDYYESLAAAYVRGSLPEESLASDGCADVLAVGREAGLRLNRFKRTAQLPRVRAVLGVLRSLAPSSLLDLGTGRGVFLWPLLDAFPELAVMVVERDPRRLAHLQAVRRGGIDRLAVLGSDAVDLPFSDAAFDVVTILEVFEHQADPRPLAHEAVRCARRCVVATVPSKPDDNPEHVRLFTGTTLVDLLRSGGAASVKISYVPNHIVAVARIAR